MDYQQKHFQNYLEEGIKWCADAKVHWAENKNFELTKYNITFNLGVLAFLAATNSIFGIKSFLYLAVLFAFLSIILAFVFMWKVCVENINYLQAKVDFMRETLVKNTKNFKAAEKYYNDKIDYADKILDKKRYFWDTIQRLSFLLFFSSVIYSLVGLLWK